MIEKEHLVPGVFSEIYLHPLIFRNVPYISGICELQQRSCADTPGSKTRLGNNQYAGACKYIAVEQLHSRLVTFQHKRWVEKSKVLHL